MTKIEWCDVVWNPVTGCTKVSAGCKNCYAERMAKRLAGRFGYPPAPDQFKVTLHPELLKMPQRWKKPRRVFVNSMSDLFHEDVPDDFIDSVFVYMKMAWSHKFIILTKRPDRMLKWFTRWTIGGWDTPGIIRHNAETIFGENSTSSSLTWPRSNIWLGVSVEDQKTANERIPLLLQTPAAKRFVSCEPLLGPIKFSTLHVLALDWVIIGGESGPGARPMNLEWAERIVNDSQPEIPVFVKQLGGFPDKRNRMEEWPENLRVREWPE